MKNELKKCTKEDLINAIDLYTDDIVELQKEKQQLEEENELLKEIVSNRKYKTFNENLTLKYIIIIITSILGAISFKGAVIGTLSYLVACKISEN